jgi:surface carbohydrate biosynthesis protein
MIPTAASLESPWVHIAVHKGARELDAKVWLAMSLVARGFNVVIGRTGAIRNLVEELPRGIYCDVRILKTRKWVFETFRRYGNKVVAFDEEATSFPDEEHYRTNLVCPDALDLCEAVFCWGPYHASAVRKALSSDRAGIVQLTGHPRFDVLREPLRAFYEHPVQELKRRHGRFFLMNSNAGGWVLDGKLEGTWKNYVDRKILKDTPEERKKFCDKYEFRRERQRNMASLAAAVARAFPTHRLVIRPHFTETRAQWTNWLPADLTNITIEHAGSAVPWMLAAEAVIHNSCTTGTEAFLADVPVLAFRPIRNDRYDAALPNALSVEAGSEHEAIAFLGEISRGDRDRVERARGTQGELFDAVMSGRVGPLASERIADVLQGLAFDDPANEDRAARLLGLRAQKRHLRSVKRRLDSMLGRARTRGVQETEIVTANVRDRVRRFGRIMGGTLPEVKEIGGEVFVVMSNSGSDNGWSKR